MRYDGIGMGGTGSGITLLVIAGLVAFMVLAALQKRNPRLMEAVISGTITLVVSAFWLAIFALVAFTISIPVSGVLDLDRGGQLTSWAIIVVALYMAGTRIK